VGRGRAKAKQVKVARKLKYDSGGTDFDRLRKELGAGASVAGDTTDDAAGVPATEDDDARARDGGDAGESA
jgi:hypothetical protein